MSVSGVLSHSRTPEVARANRPSVQGEASPVPVQRDVMESGVARTPVSGRPRFAQSLMNLGFVRKTGTALALTAALLGAGALAPATASAQDLHHRPLVFQQFHRYGHERRGVGIGGALTAGVLAGIATDIILNGQTVHLGPGYIGVGCDGYQHRFDRFGNVWDGSGHYFEGYNQYGQCVTTPPRY